MHMKTCNYACTRRTDEMWFVALASSATTSVANDFKAVILIAITAAKDKHAKCQKQCKTQDGVAVILASLRNVTIDTYLHCIAALTAQFMCLRGRR